MVIALSVVASILGLIIISAAIFLLLRRRRKQQRPVSDVPSGDIMLTNVDKYQYQNPQDSLFPTPAPVYEKPRHPLHGVFAPEQALPRIELPGAQQEPHQLPDGSENGGDYFAVARAMRAAATPEVQGSYVIHELPASVPEPVEMDDEESRTGTLSPSSSKGPSRPPNTLRRLVGRPRTPDTTLGSPRVPSPASPLSAFSWSAMTTPTREQREGSTF
jgi:hypothetical protein